MLVYENRDVIPRYFVVHRWDGYSTDDRVLVVDWECQGKQERQSGYDTQVKGQTVESSVACGPKRPA